MNESSHLGAVAQAARLSHRSWRYLAVGLAANAAVWGIGGYTLRESPRLYTSQWAVMLMGGAKSTIAPRPNPESLRNDPLAAKAQDLKARYRLIVATDEVRKAAAAKIGMTADQLGTPQVEAIDSSTLMKFEISGSTPEEAQSKAQALHEALQERLNQLRIRHTTEQAAGFEDSLSAARKKVETAKAKLSDYKTKSGVITVEQINQLAAEIETLQQVRTETLAQQRTSSRWSSQLSDALRTRTGSDRDDVFKDLVRSNTEQQDLTLQAQAIDRELADLKQRLNDGTQQRKILEGLQRDTQIAEAVFSSTLAGLNARKLDVFSAYPPVQVVAEPTLPETATLPRQQPILLTAAIVSLGLTIGLSLAWVRKMPFAARLLRRFAARLTA